MSAQRFISSWLLASNRLAGGGDGAGWGGGGAAQAASDRTRASAMAERMKAGMMSPEVKAQPVELHRQSWRGHGARGARS